MSAFIDQERERFAVELICRTLGVSASAYYARATGERSARAIDDEQLLERIRKIHSENYEAYGYRRTWKALRRAGEPVGRDRVKRLMRAHGIQGAKRRGKPWRTTTPDPAAARRPDLVERDFTARRPNELWVADLTYLRSWEGLSFLAFVLDAYSRMIVGWQLARHMRTDLVLDALRMALHLRGPGADVELVHHSDRGSQYTSFDYTQELRDHGVLASVGSVGDAYDNALAEKLRRLAEDRADRRPRLAHALAARARLRRVGRLVQQRATARGARRPAAGRVRGARPGRRRRLAALALRARSARPRHHRTRGDYVPIKKLGIQLNRSPWNPARLKPSPLQTRPSGALSRMPRTPPRFCTAAEVPLICGVVRLPDQVCGAERQTR